MSAMSPLRFQVAGESALRRELMLEADIYLKSRGTDRFGDGWLALKAAGLAAVLLMAYAFSLMADTRWQFVPTYVVFLFLAMVLAMNTLHDAAHGALFRSRRLNRWWTRLAGILVGIDAGYWTLRHVHFHHAYANIEGYDLDTEPNPFLRQTPFQAWSPQYRYQHIYWPLVAALSLPYLCWYSDWADRFGMTKVAGSNGTSGWREWAAFLLAKAAHTGIVLVLPALASRQAGIGWGALAGWYLLGQMLASCMLVAMILGTHWAEVEFFQPGVGGRMPHTWQEHSLLTTCDWTPEPAWIGYWLGGLNAHLTHHLFPTYSHRHYPALARIVARVALRHGLAYRELSYSQLIASQQTFLRTMGRPPAAPVQNR